MLFNTVKTNFTGGEIDPLLYGRMETPRYQNGCEKIFNAFVLPTGGARRSPGTRFVSNAGAGITVRQIPFLIMKKDVTPPVTQGYKIELRSDEKIRFYTNNALIMDGANPYEITSPFTDANLKLINFEGFDNVLYLTHPDFPPQQLTRTSDTNWAIAGASISQPNPALWDAASGYPRAITFFEQRMILGGTKAKPQNIFCSRSGEILNFITGTGDADAFSYQLVQASSSIYHLAATKQITVFTAREEIFVYGSSDKALTPTNIQVKRRGKKGTIEDVSPLVLGDQLLYVTRFAKKLRQLGYDFATDSYNAPDQSIIAAHLLTSGITDLDIADEPFTIVWILTGAGKLVALSMDKEQDVIAFSRRETSGVVKDICVIPGTANDQEWMAVERVINGTTYTYIEYMDSSLNTDSAYVGTDAQGKTTWDVPHLAGRTVDIVADGIVMPQQVVTNNQVVLPRAAKAVEIGLHYESEVIDLPVAMQTPLGVSRGMAVSAHEIQVMLHESLGCEVQGEVIPFRKFGLAILDKPITPFTGLKKVNDLGWDKEGKITIKQTQPLPFTVLAIIKKVTVNG